MARSPKPLSLRPHPLNPRDVRDLADRDAWPSGFDPSYGESLGQLLPKRLSDLAPRP